MTDAQHRSGASVVRPAGTPDRTDLGVVLNSTPEPQTARYRCAEEADAAQWTGSNAEQLRAFCGSNFDTIDPEDRGEDPDETAAVRAHPHGGWLGLKPGDWVVKHADHFSAASDEEFRARWTPASAPSADQASTARPEVDDPRVLALAKARQHIAHSSVFNVVCPPWDGLDAQEQHLSLLDARNYLHAALSAGLVPAAAVSVAVPPTLERRDRYAQAIRDTDGWVLDDGQHMLDAVLAVADAEQTALRTRVACLTTALGEAVQHVGSGEVSLQTFERWRAVRDAQPDDGQTDTRAAIVAEVVSELEALRDTVDVQVAEYPRYDARQKSALNDAISRVRQLAAVLPQPETQAGHDLAPLFEGFGRLLATSSRDWGQYAPDAWLYAVILGWDCEEDVHGDETCTHGAMEEMAERHGWDDATVAKARRYRAAVRAITEAAAPAVVSQPDEEATRCSTPTACDAETGEPCERHEREQSHADNDHSLCRRADCEVLRQT